MATRENTWNKVRAACKWLADNRQKITVQAVADKATITRQTIYHDPKLLEFVVKFEKSYHFQKGKDAGTADYNRGYHDGHAAALRELKWPRHGSSGSVEWARGILHIDPKEKLTAELVKQRFRQLSKLLHTDKGGVKELQQNVNEANEILKRAVGD